MINLSYDSIAYARSRSYSRSQSSRGSITRERERECERERSRDWDRESLLRYKSPIRSPTRYCCVVNNVHYLISITYII